MSESCNHVNQHVKSLVLPVTAQKHQYYLTVRPYMCTLMYHHSGIFQDMPVTNSGHEIYWYCIINVMSQNFVVAQPRRHTITFESSCFCTLQLLALPYVVFILFLYLSACEMPFYQLNAVFTFLLQVCVCWPKSSFFPIPLQFSYCYMGYFY